MNEIKFIQKYFVTPSTSIDSQRQIEVFCDFEPSNIVYQKNASRIIIKRYKVYEQN